MREIKFRAFDGHTKKMFPVCELCYDGGKLSMVGIDTPDISLLRVIGEEEIELMQYTGLKDSKGVEIYEGDIIEFNECNYPHNRVRGKIVWGEDIGEGWGCGFGATVISRRRSEGIGDMWAGLAIPEIIGNIYETPELLNERKENETQEER